jgi:hypothetical protein
VCGRRRDQKVRDTNCIYPLTAHERERERERESLRLDITVSREARESFGRRTKREERHTEERVRWKEEKEGAEIERVCV